MHSTRCLLRCGGAWGCCACSVPSAQRLRSTCTHPSCRRAASAGRIASATSQWVAAGLVLPRPSSECSCRGGIGVLTHGVSSTLLVFLIAIALRVHIPLRPEPPATGPPSAAITPRACPAATAPSPAGSTRTPSQQPSLTRTRSCASLQEPTGRRAHGQSSSQTVESPNAAEPTCDSTRKQRETQPLHHAQQQMAAPQQQRTHHEKHGISTTAELAHRPANHKFKSNKKQ
ncbi:hypothetical protein TcCL_Unassigned00850 [Trypanosoma cruzi]|nr:hypothetical protein TcCL_Unassigned00850 [Trypanosoma cruzi]